MANRTPKEHPRQAAIDAALARIAAGEPVNKVARELQLSVGLLYNRRRSLSKDSLNRLPLTKPDSPIQTPIVQLAPAAAGSPANQIAQVVNGPAVGEQVPNVAAELAAADAAQLREYGSWALVQHRRRARALWRKLAQLANDPACGAGPKSTPAAALAALTQAHERLVKADRLLLGMAPGDIDPVPQAAAAAERPVLAMVAELAPDDWDQLASQHKRGGSVRARSGAG